MIINKKNDHIGILSICSIIKYDNTETGDVVTKDCVEKIIKPDMMHPLTGVKLEKSDLIELQRGGTGYSSSNEILTAKSYRPSLAIN